MASGDRILVTGGAGFIGSATADLLIERGYGVTILDNLDPQVHPSGIPAYLNPSAQFVVGDIRDQQTVGNLLRQTDAVIHLAAAVGTSQSIYQVARYVDVNTRGTSVLLDAAIHAKNRIRKIVVASSMSLYGEGSYRCDKCGEERYPGLRHEEDLRKRIWEPLCPGCKSTLRAGPTREDKPPMPASIYAQTKRHQEEMALLLGRTYSLPVVALRYFNVYGPRQALTNPYTGVAAIFLNRILNDKSPYIFEDGRQLRDFIHVSDVAKANVLALERDTADYQALNIGTGKPTSIETIAKLLARTSGKEIEPTISSNFRKGDVRHCYADATKARKLLGFRVEVDLEKGFRDLSDWARSQDWGRPEQLEGAMQELEERKLVLHAAAATRPRGKTSAAARAGKRREGI